MKIFLAGATGVIGRELLPALVREGHTVTGMTRRPEKAEAIVATGATAAVCDAYDAPTVTRAMRESAPEVVVHLLTDLPDRLNPRRASTSTDRLRREGTANLLDAAEAAGAQRFIAESIAFGYEPGGRGPKTEDHPLWTDAPGSFADTVRAIQDLEDQVLRRASLEGTVLRFGWLYGPGTYFAPDGSIPADLKRRMYPVVGQGTGTWSFVRVADAARAVVCALDGAPGVYNITDDDPAPMHEWLPHLAAAVGAPKPWRVPAWVARLVAGPAAARMATDLPGADNSRAMSALGWKPQYASWRRGFLEELGQDRP